MAQHCKLEDNVCQCPRDTAARVRDSWECLGPFSDDELEACYLDCKDRRRPSHVDDDPSRCLRSCQCINGCGSYTKPWSRTIGNFVANTKESLCCDEHDRCYNSFGANKKTCDDVMYDCLLETSENDNWFTQQAKKVKFKAMWEAVHLGGDEAFESGQRDGTECVPTVEGGYGRWLATVSCDKEVNRCSDACLAAIAENCKDNEPSYLLKMYCHPDNNIPLAHLMSVCKHSGCERWAHDKSKLEASCEALFS